MFRKFWYFYFCIVLNSVFIIPTYAEGKFRTGVEVTYKVQESGITTVTNKITLENLFASLHNFILVNFDNIKPANLTAFQEEKITH